MQHYLGSEAHPTKFTKLQRDSVCELTNYLTACFVVLFCLVSITEVMLWF